ncbi:MAG: exodeoxyribonuclease VII large subunit [Bacteroidia bacterium]|jgi:exodeoxyribonuclease VII large subunit|nr:exodeoxyribonuclease VII large subunit [Bacteroidia bacterium]
MSKAALRLSQLQDLVRGALEDAFRGQSWWVLAELEDVTDQGHRIFFTLIEKGSDNMPSARLSGAVLSPQPIMLFRNFEDITGKFVKDLAGQQVLMRVTVTVHRTAGLRLNVLDIDHHFMLGQLEQQRQETYRQLASKPGVKLVNGRWHTPNKALELPVVIQHIAVITSATAAGYEDFVHKLRGDASGFGFAVEGFFARLQGEGAAESMREQLVAVYERHQQCPFDVVVLIRGGGAQSDLLPFDSFTLAWPVAKFPVPVITGIGHQRNESITDTMAHTSLKTPTEAAQFILSHNLAFEAEVNTAYQHIIHRSSSVLAMQRLSLEKTSATLATGIRGLLNRQNNILTRAETLARSGARSLLRNAPAEISQLQQRIVSGALHSTQNAHHALAQAKNVLAQRAPFLLQKQHHQLALLAQRVELLHPANVLKRGYAYVSRHEQIITTAKQVNAGEEITVHFADGQLTTLVKNNTANE